VWGLAWVLFVNRAGTMVLPFLVLYLTETMGFRPSVAGLALSVYGAGACLGAWLGGWLTDRIGARPVMLASMFSSGVAFFILGQMESLTGILVAMLVLSVINESFRPANGATLAACCPRHLQKKAFALARLAVNAGMTIGPAVGGVLAVRDFSLLFLADGGTCVLAGMLLLFLRQTRDAPPAEGEDGPGQDGSPWRDRSFLVFAGLLSLMAMLFFQIFATYPLHFREIYGFREDTIGFILAINTLVIVAFEMILVHSIRDRGELRLIGLGCALLGLGLGLGLLPFSSCWGRSHQCLFLTQKAG